jgi:hypothetical protein
MVCTVNLKDRSRAGNEEEKNWYNQAFGTERNMMNLNVIYQPNIPRRK